MNSIIEAYRRLDIAGAPGATIAGGQTGLLRVPVHDKSCVPERRINGARKQSQLKPSTDNRQAQNPKRIRIKFDSIGQMSAAKIPWEWLIRMG